MPPSLYLLSWKLELNDVLRTGIAIIKLESPYWLTASIRMSVRLIVSLIIIYDIKIPGGHGSYTKSDDSQSQLHLSGV